MKKFLMICLCLVLFGCSSQQKVEKESHIQDNQIGEIHKKWIGQYMRDDGVVIEFLEDNMNDKNTLSFTVELGVKGFGNFAYIQENQYQAIYDIEEDGHTLEFLLNKDKLIVEESGGMTYLNTDLSGEYTKQ